MLTDVKTRLYYKASAGKYKGRFVKLNFRIKSLKVMIKVSGMGQTRTYSIDWMKILEKLRQQGIKRITPDILNIIKGKFREIGRELFEKEITSKTLSFKKVVKVGNKKLRKQDIKNKNRFYNENLESDIDVDYEHYEDDKIKRVVLKFDTSYKNHPTFILLALGINDFYNPKKFKKLNIYGEVGYNSAMARGEYRPEIFNNVRTKMFPFKFEFFDKLFKIKNYWLIPKNKNSAGITPVGMISYNIRDIIEGKGFTISGSFQRKRVKNAYIEWYSVYLDITAVKTYDDKFYNGYIKKMQSIKDKMNKDKKRMKFEYKKHYKRGKDFLKKFKK